MIEASRSRPHPSQVWALCILAGFMVGVSGFSSESNHPTYLPPGLRYIDPRFLAHDWWLNSAHHYHFAFFALVAGLARLGILEVGLAVLNIAAVAVAMYGSFRMIRRMRAEYPLTALALMIALVVASYGFCTIGSAFLFSASLQPSTIATTATILALAAFVEGRLGRCGLWLALAGAFHANFLLVNFMAFGLAYTLVVAQARPWRKIISRDVMLGFVRLLWPSLVIAAISAPLILSFQTESLSPAVAAEADRIFFHVAVPFHYYPRSYLLRFPAFLALEVLGFVWTGRAVADLMTRRMALALQIALAVLIWSATALTTLVFIAPVSRLFFWRLAPFALMLAALMTVVGMMRVIARTDHDGPNVRGDSVRLLLSLCALPFLALSGSPLIHQWLYTAPLQPEWFLFVAIFVVAVARHLAREDSAIGKAALVGISGAALVFGLLAQPVPDTRYSLLYESPAEQSEEQLFRYVRESTSPDTQFVIPPDLDFFRLKARRAVVVDFKALPLDRSDIAEWYHRLEAISGTRNAGNGRDIELGYRKLDAVRLEQLRCRYGVTDVVLKQPDSLHAAGWSEVFHNRGFRVLQLTGNVPCAPAARH